ncbi:hypothetical protein GE09DRAFT_1232336 [Coniochaeta sp. 2T2.1]|nr:hypothetical protein GE09DRAFT_1232336 [Coniochaeta sp. 2T2.1]
MGLLGNTATVLVGLLPFTSAAPAGTTTERDIQDAIKAAARAAPEHGVADVRSAPMAAAKRCPALDGGALDDKMYEGVDIRLRAENMSHGG